MSKRSERKVDAVLEKLERGRKLLAAWGIHGGSFPPDTPPSQVIETLAPFIGRDPACDLVIAEWLGGLGDPAAAERLIAWEPSAGKDLKREIRRSLFRLEQKGIRAARPEEPRPSFSLRSERPEPEGYLGHIDGEGSRMAWLLRRDGSRAGGLFSVVNDRDGMLSLDAGVIPGGKIEAMLKGSDNEEFGALVSAPWPYVDALMHAAFKRAPPRPANMNCEYLLERAGLTGPGEPEAVPSCPIRQVLPLETLQDASLLEGSVDLFKEKEFRSWVLPQDAARPHIQALLNLGGSGLVISRETSKERFAAITEAALAEFVAGPQRDAYVRRLEEMAWFFHLQGRAEPAKRCAAVAAALASPEGRRMQDVSFLRGFVLRAFLPVLAASRRQADPAEPASETADGSSLILDPSKVREPGVPGAGQVEGPDEKGPSLIITP